LKVDDSEEEEEELKNENQEADDQKAKDYDKKKKKKTKEDIQREALLMENLYATLGLENITFEASDADIGRAYKQAALHFHPDKLGDKFTEGDKEVWLKI
jgi:DnaJ-class molecular chaperone